MPLERINGREPSPHTPISGEPLESPFIRSLFIYSQQRRLSGEKEDQTTCLCQCVRILILV